MKDFEVLYDELVVLSRELRPYYDIDKVKSYSVYVWTKGEPEEDTSENVFDIVFDKIIFYTEHEIIEDAKPIIEKIQRKLQEMESCIRM